MTLEYIPFFKPEIGDEEIQEVVECLKSGWLTTASRTKRFEADFATYVGAVHAVALNSCTAALHLALDAIGLKENELVLVPTFTFAATAEVVRYFNAIPVLVDCRESDFCMDMEHAADILARLDAGRPVRGVPEKHGGVRAIVPVHFAGQVADVIRCRELCVRYGLGLVEDCAHCCPAYYQDGNEWKMVGRSADIACFSFYANKTITTGEGGMAVTDNADQADRMRVMSLHGISKDAWKRFSRSGSWQYEIVAPGFKYNLTDIAASLGIHQLAKASSFLERRRKVASEYSECLFGVPGIVLPSERGDRVHSWHLYILRILESDFGMHRNAFIEEMKQQEIGTGVHYVPLHLHPYYRERYGYEPGDFPVATRLSEEIVSMPLYPSLGESQLSRICDAVRAISRM